MDPPKRVHLPEGRLGLLSETTRAFAEATGDYDRLLWVVAERLAEGLRDGCVVRLLSDDGWLRPVAVHLPVREQIPDEAERKRLLQHVLVPHHVSEQASARRVIETGAVVLVPRLDLDELRRSTAASIVDAFETMGIHSLLMVAMRVRGKSIGLLSLVRFRTPEPFSEPDVELAQTLADHASLAIDNANSLKVAKHELAERERAEGALHKAELQLRHAQKMEAIGRLAGSVAHDFNNQLSVILGYGISALGELKDADPLREDLSEIVRAGERSSDLTRQLLAFSRQQVLAPRALDLSAVVRDCEKLLRRLVGPNIEVVVRSSASLSSIRADASQMEQVIMNLAINARDAMPAGGKLTIETADVVLDDASAAELGGVRFGPHVMLVVNDTGHGMDAETQAHIFEPFFTTKEVGRGTGSVYPRCSEL